MKKLYISLFAVFCFGLASCDEAKLTIYSAEWTAYVDGYGVGNIALTVSGNADSVTVRTYGDGAIADQQLLLDEHGNFSETVIVSFSHEPDLSAAVSASTLISATKGDSSESEMLESGNLTYTTAP